MVTERCEGNSEIGTSSSLSPCSPHGLTYSQVDESIDTRETDTGVGALELSNSMSDRLICHGRMNIIADYYNVTALAELSSAKVQELLASEWSVEPFCDLLRECLGSTSDKSFFRMLGAEAANHFDELFERHVFDEGGIGAELAPYALPICILRLKAAKAHEKELESSLSYERDTAHRNLKHPDDTK
ncbi:hypothetical protein F5B17DRAFT_411335 [Nemania serpens]|nr:hypothetical protein F5B17DRAFT_411335 [Nemania serpens]